MQIIIENTNFSKKDICLSKFEYFDKKGTLLFSQNRLFCEKYGNTETNSIEKIPTKFLKLKVGIILITTLKKIGSECI